MTKLLIFAICLILILGTGALYLSATSNSGGAQGIHKATAFTPTSTLAATNNRRSVTSVALITNQPSHAIGAITLSPTIIDSGSTQPITVTASISDPTLIATSVNLIYSRPNSSGTTIVGTLHDDGINGDIIAGDKIFTLVVSLPSSSPPGEIDFQISAAFQGVLTRTKSAVMPLVVNPRPNTNTSSWITINDSHALFTISAPADWNLKLVEADSPDSFTTESDQFVLPDGTSLFTIEVYTPSQWEAVSSGGITPLLIGSSSQYYFGLGQAQDIEDTSNVSATQILLQLPSIYSSFSAH